MNNDRMRKDLATEWINASEKIDTNIGNLAALTWLRREQERWARRIGRDAMVIIARGSGPKTQYALAYAGLFKGENGEEVVEE